MTRAVLLSWLLVGGTAASAAAQQAPPPSQKGTVSQTINTTVVSVEYHRPTARGRVLFGDSALVRYGALWTAGANRATIVELSRAARIAGTDVPAGRYSLWMMPGPAEWTLILNRTWDTHHASYPGEATDVMRATVTPHAAAHMETLAFYFPEVTSYNAMLLMHWGTTAVPIPIEVER